MMIVFFLSALRFCVSIVTLLVNFLHFTVYYFYVLNSLSINLNTRL
jgi:hypothetical protein